MKKNLTVLNQIGDYTLCKWDSQYVVAWKYDDTTQDWCQGYYHETLQNAEKTFREKVNQ